MQTLVILSAVVFCAFANYGGQGGFSLPPITDAQKAEFKARAQEKLATLSPEAQTAGNAILTAVEANEGNFEATRTAVDAILSGVSDSVKQELRSILPGGGRRFGGYPRPTTPSA